MRDDPSYVTLIGNRCILLTIKKSVPIGKVIKDFCKRQNEKNSTIRMFFDGQRIADYETPDDLDLKNGDDIDIFWEMYGGGWSGKKKMTLDEVKEMLYKEDKSDENELQTNDRDKEIWENEVEAPISDIGSHENMNKSPQCHSFEPRVRLRMMNDTNVEEITDYQPTSPLNPEDAVQVELKVSKSATKVNDEGEMLRMEVSNTCSVNERTDFEPSASLIPVDEVLAPISDTRIHDEMNESTQCQSSEPKDVLRVHLRMINDTNGEKIIDYEPISSLNPDDTVLIISSDSPETTLEPQVLKDAPIDEEDRKMLGTEEYDTNENLKEHIASLNLNHEINVSSFENVQSHEDLALDWLEKLKQEHSEGKLSKNNPLDKKIICFLNLPQLQPIDIKILKNVVEMKEKHKDWEKEKNQLDLQLNLIESKEKRKRKGKILGEKVNRNLRRKPNVVSSSSIEETEEEDRRGQKTLNNAAAKKSNEVKNTGLGDDTSEVCFPTTPKQRDDLRQKFGMSSPSPLMKRQKITEDEMRRFSLSVHLWAQTSKIELNETRLTKKHFKSILDFAGPGSKLHLIKGRPILQYKCMWRNITQGRHYFRGHPETGFETKSKVHDPTKPFCPFEHCNTSLLPQIDITLLNSEEDKRKDDKEISIINISKKLFSHDACSETEDSLRVESSKLDVNKLSWNQVTKIHIDEAKNLSEEDIGQSPSKEELKYQNFLLFQRIQFLNKKETVQKTRDIKDAEIKIPTLIRCNVMECNKSYSTVFGLLQHQKMVHGEENIEKNRLRLCSICGKGVVYISQHIRDVHKNVKRICEICDKSIEGDMKKHRGICNLCPYCGYKNSKKARLSRHVKNCKDQPVQSEALDLTSPMKNVDENDNNEIPKSNDSNKSQFLKNVTPLKETNVKKPMERRKKINFERKDSLLSGSFIIEGKLNERRVKFPFDDVTEDYESELEEHDDEEYTRKRRMIKDKLEARLRDIDELKSSGKSEDEEIVEKFRLFMQKKKNKTTQTGKFSKLNEVSTIDKYTSILCTEIIPAFHKLFTPFNSAWILDCKTPKNTKFDGEVRSFVSPEEPIYMSSRIVEEALKKYDPYLPENGNKRAQILGTTREFMDFIELSFNQRINLYGPEPLKTVMTYHEIVRKFITATGAWKICNDGKKKTLINNKIISQYENPQKDLEILERYTKYTKSKERLNDIEKVMYYSETDAPPPSEGEFTKCGNITMGEIITSTGCRPIVARHLVVGAWVDKKPGFDTGNVPTNDEEHDDQAIFRRVDPTLPPKHKACKHQLENKSADCPILCDERSIPDGYNILVTWDKTSSTNGSSYLHLKHHVKVLMDLYFMIRSKYFGNRISAATDSDNWLHEEETPFFINSNGSSFKYLDLKHISNAIGIDVTSYSFRKIVSTWALSHNSEEIRGAEEESLQHGLKVAREHYLQNKMVKPQKLISTYVEEENIHPESFKKILNKGEIMSQENVKETEEKQKKQRHGNLIKGRESYKRKQMDMKPLGLRQRITNTNKNKFRNLLEKITGEKVEVTLLQKKPAEWRKYIVRNVCIDDPIGEEIRELWMEVYKGDLKFGVRDARLKAIEKQVSRSNTFRSLNRNSWIVRTLRTSFLAGITVKATELMINS